MLTWSLLIAIASTLTVPGTTAEDFRTSCETMRDQTLERSSKTCHCSHTPRKPSRVRLVEELGLEISADCCILGMLRLQQFRISLEVLKDDFARLRVDGLDPEQKQGKPNPFGALMRRPQENNTVCRQCDSSVIGQMTASCGGRMDERLSLEC